MKIKNDLISIKMGKKQYDFQNLILDEYLKTFVTEQLSPDNISKIKNMKALKYLLIKFDTPLNNINEKSILKNEDFDICFVWGSTYSYKQENSESRIIVQYKYETSIFWNVWDYKKMTANNIYLSDYYGKKITALGFNTYWTASTLQENPVKAVLDVSNYNIYLQENQEFAVTRKDIITTDSLFYSNDRNKVKAPIHLMPTYNKAVITPNVLNKVVGDTTFYHNGLDESYGVIYSVGLSSYFNRIDKEFVIGKDIEIIQNETEIQINDINNLLSKYTEYLKNGLYPRTGLYPLQSNYRFLILKYKVWQKILSGTYDEPINTMTDTGYYYYQAIPITLSGKLNLKIKYERG